MEFVNAVVTLLTSVAWPAAVIVIAVIYKVDIQSLLPRLRKAGPTGVELDPAEQQKKVSSTAVVQPGSVELKQLPGVGRTPAIEQVEREIHVSLSKIDEENRTDILVRSLAESQLAATFERIYNVIFGSQITVLKRLNELGQVSIADAKEFYEQVAADHPDVYSRFSFEAWLGFLISQGLVRTHDGFLQITELGREFLLYITVRRMPENKGL